MLTGDSYSQKNDVRPFEICYSSNIDPYSVNVRILLLKCESGLAVLRSPCYKYENGFYKFRDALLKCESGLVKVRDVC